MLHLRSLLPVLAVCLSGIGLVACQTTQQPTQKTPVAQVIQAPTSAKGALAYDGLFISQCAEFDKGLYYADALELKPQNGTTVSAQYIKTFFAGTQCDPESRLVQLRMPLATWEVVKSVKINDKNADQMNVTLAAGLIKGIVANSSQVKETSTMFDISFGSNGAKLPLQKQTDGAVEKELLLVEGNKLYFSQTGSPLTADGFPTELALDDAFFKQ